MISNITRLLLPFKWAKMVRCDVFFVMAADIFTIYHFHAISAIQPNSTMPILQPPVIPYGKFDSRPCGVRCRVSIWMGDRIVCG